MQTILELERVAAAHWRGTQEQWLGDWLLRAAEGFTGRANSVLPLGDPGLPLDEALAAVTQWYQARGLPPMIAVPTGLGTDQTGQDLARQLSQRRFTTRPGPAFVMVADLPLPRLRAGTRPPAGAIIETGATSVSGEVDAGGEVTVASEPDDAWAAMYHYRGQPDLPPVARKVLTSAEHQSFVSIRSGGQVQAIARLSVARDWAGLTAVEVDPAHRRQGLGTAITAAACRTAREHGVDRVFLQVETTNVPARTLYERLGFRYSHQYAYRVAPA